MPITLSGDGITSDNIVSLAASKLTGSVPLANGGNRIIKSTEFVNSTRQTFSAADTITYWSVTYTKQSNTSDLYIEVLLPIFGNYNDGSYTGIRIDGSDNFKGFGRATSAGAGMVTLLQRRTGISAGSRTISVYQDVIDNTSNYIIPVLNPNSSDDARNQQNASVMIIHEIEP